MVEMMPKSFDVGVTDDLVENVPKEANSHSNEKMNTSFNNNEMDEFAEVDDADFAIEGDNDEEDITASAASQDVASDMYIQTVCLSCGTPFTPMTYSTVLLCL